MKKIALVLAVLLCALPMMAFAEIAVTGSVSFSIGDSTESTTTLPVFTGASSVAGSVTIATDDEKVVASATFNLLPTVTTTYTAYSDGVTYSTATSTDIDERIDDYQTYATLSGLVDFFNDHVDDETAVDEDSIWDADVQDDLEAELENGALDLVQTDDDADDILIKTPEAVDGTVTAGEEFEFTAANIALMNTIASDFQTKLEEEIQDAIENILAEASSNVDFNYGADYAFDELPTYLAGLDEAELSDWTDDDKAVVKAAVDLEVAYLALGAAGDPTVTSTLAFVETASLAFNNIGGVVDVVATLKGAHVAAGAISVDGSGHTSTAVSGYPSLMVGLSSGVVEGLNAGVTLYIDANDAQDAVSDTWYTWLDEAESQADPVYGLGVNAGYTMAMGDMTVGGTVVFGMYDLMGGADLDWAVSVAPSFSGFGANVGVQFDYGIEMMYLMACADYTIMGITPSVAFHMINETGDNVLAYSASPASTMAKFKDGNDQGMLLEAGLAVDLTELVGMGITVNGGMDLGLTGDAATEYGWNAGLAVAGLVDGLTVGFDCDADTVEGSTFDWAVSTSYAYSIATLTASIGSDYDSDDEEAYTTWSLGASVAF